jgi:hypothetical protein
MTKPKFLTGDYLAYCPPKSNVILFYAISCRSHPVFAALGAQDGTLCAADAESLPAICERLADAGLEGYITSELDDRAFSHFDLDWARELAESLPCPERLSEPPIMLMQP